jgi:hypothetical protein
MFVERSIGYRCFQKRDAAKPKSFRCSTQLAGMFIIRETPNPRGRVPSTPACTMSGARKPSEGVSSQNV